MKEATGELNATVVVVMIVALCSIFFFFILWPGIKDSFITSSRCSDAICDKNSVRDGHVDCVFIDKSGREIDMTCPWKG